MVTAQPNVIYVDANGNPIQLPPGVQIRVVAPGAGDAAQPSTSYAAESAPPPVIAKREPAPPKPAAARARKVQPKTEPAAQHQVVVYATNQFDPGANVPTTCTVTVRNDPIGQPPPRPLGGGSLSSSFDGASMLIWLKISPFRHLEKDSKTTVPSKTAADRSA